MLSIHSILAINSMLMVLGLIVITVGVHTLKTSGGTLVLMFISMALALWFSLFQDISAIGFAVLSFGLFRLYRAYVLMFKAKAKIEELESLTPSDATMEA
jgi:hypothetical protein